MKTRQMIYVSLFAVLTAVGAKITVPVPFVPFTLQTLFCILAGLLLGPKYGAASQAFYMFMGLAGIPVFTGGGGLSSILSPSFGYVVGFVACGWVTGKMISGAYIAHGIPRMRDYLAASLTGIAAVYLFGLAHLYVIVNFWMPGNGMPLMKVLSIGFLSTVGGDVLKAFLSSAIAIKIMKTSSFAGMR